MFVCEVSSVITVLSFKENRVVLTFESKSITIQIKATEWFFHLVLFVVDYLLLNRYQSES